MLGAFGCINGADLGVNLVNENIVLYVFIIYIIKYSFIAMNLSPTIAHIQIYIVTIKTTIKF